MCMFAMCWRSGALSSHWLLELLSGETLGLMPLQEIFYADVFPARLSFSAVVPGLGILNGFLSNSECCISLWKKIKPAGGETYEGQSANEKSHLRIVLLYPCFSHVMLFIHSDVSSPLHDFRLLSPRLGHVVNLTFILTPPPCVHHPFSFHHLKCFHLYINLFIFHSFLTSCIFVW